MHNSPSGSFSGVVDGVGAGRYLVVVVVVVVVGAAGRYMVVGVGDWSGAIFFM